MTVSSTTNKSGPYNGNGSTSAFAASFKYTDVDDVEVIVTSAAGVETVKTLNTHYTLSAPGDSGTVTFITSPDHRPQTGEKVTIRRTVASTQEYDPTTGGGITSAAIEAAFDYVTFLIQQVHEKVLRAPKLRASTATGEITIAEPSALAFLRWNSAGTGIENGTTGGPGSGDVVGPASSTDNAITRFDGTSGQALQDSNITISDAGVMAPTANDGGALGTATDSWADLFLASGGVVNWASGDVTITHSSNQLAFAGASSGYSFDAAALPSANDAAALGSAAVSWADLFLASGAAVNFNNGDVTITHSTNALAFAGAANEYSFDNDITQQRERGLWTNRPSYKGTSVTITIASPGVISWTAHGLRAGQRVAFLTTGTLPTGIIADTNYFVSATGLTANSFQISATDGGASINTSGSQSGTHRGYIVGVNIARIERLFVGAACVNDGTKIPTGSGADWLETRAQFTTSNAEFAVVAESGRGAIVAGIRSIDNEQVPSNGIACSIYNFNDNAASTTDSWGIYVESQRSSGAGFTTCMELAPVDFGTPVSIDPYSTDFSGVVAGIWNASGGGEVGINDTSVGLAFLNNGSQFQKGIYFHKDSIDGTDGVTGTGSAIAMALGHRIDWFSAASVKGVSVWASAIATLNIGSTDISTEAFNLELGAGRTGNGSCRIDMHSAASTDYETRIVRLSGANGNFQIENTGTGSLQLNANNAAGIIQFLTNGVEGLRIGTDQSVRSVAPLGGVGYGTGAGGTVTQLTNKTTAVTLNKVCGQITMEATTAIAAGANATFTLTNSAIATTDTVVACVDSGGTANAYTAQVVAVGAGSCAIKVTNTTAGSLSEAPVINFAVIKAVIA